MSEKRNWIKETLDWLHHAFWIREFIISIGGAGVVMQWISNRVPAIADYKWWFVFLLTGISMYAWATIRNSGKSTPQDADELTASQTTPQKSTSSNALSRNVPHDPGTFNSVEFFRTAYYSSLQDTARNSFLVEAERVKPYDKESFYLDVLAVGFMGVHYDQIWWPLYRSQLRALLAVNRKNGLAPVAEFREFYEEAKKEFSSEYERLNISFESWLSYLQSNVLIVVHPSNMIEITLKGKDFLKYLLHWGRQEELKRL